MRSLSEVKVRYKEKERIRKNIEGCRGPWIQDFPNGGGGGGVGMDVAAGRVPLNLLPCVLKVTMMYLNMHH